MARSSGTTAKPLAAYRRRLCCLSKPAQYETIKKSMTTSVKITNNSRIVTSVCAELARYVFRADTGSNSVGIICLSEMTADILKEPPLNILTSIKDADCDLLLRL
jgi:hypothetical protein